MKGVRLEKLVNFMERLRGPSGCPWDKEQNLESLIPYIIEEAYEVVEAIEERAVERLKEEIGDLLFQIIFLSQIAKESNWFDIGDVLSTTLEKMVRRHPHVFGEKKASSSREALHSWNKAKKEEKKNEDTLSGIPTNLPALLMAQKVSEKASLTGFDWERVEDCLKKLDEEVYELKEVISKGIKEGIEDEMGDIIFTLINIGRFFDINLERSLRKTTHRFISRFNSMVAMLKKEGRTIKGLSLSEMEEFWEGVKEIEDSQKPPSF